MGKCWPLRRKALKLKPLPRAYIKVGCHHHPPTHQHPKFNFTQLMARECSGEVGGGKGRCGVTMVHLRVTMGHLRLTIGHPRP